MCDVSMLEPAGLGDPALGKNWAQESLFPVTDDARGALVESGVPPPAEDVFGGFKVEKICATMHDPATGAQQYLVQWAGYTEAENTWENAVDLMNCPQLKMFLEAPPKDQPMILKRKSKTRSINRQRQASENSATSS